MPTNRGKPIHELGYEGTDSKGKVNSSQHIRAHIGPISRICPIRRASSCRRATDSWSPNSSKNSSDAAETPSASVRPSALGTLTASEVWTPFGYLKIAKVYCAGKVSAWASALSAGSKLPTRKFATCSRLRSAGARARAMIRTPLSQDSPIFEVPEHASARDCTVVCTVSEIPELSKAAKPISSTLLVNRHWFSCLAT